WLAFNWPLSNTTVQSAEAACSTITGRKRRYVRAHQPSAISRFRWKTMSFYVEKAQGHAILVDRGRQHAQRHGLTQYGPMDEYSFVATNQFLSNALDRARFAITLGNMVLKAQQAAMLATTGANIPVTVNGVSIANWSSHFVRRCHVINIGFFNGQGPRLYL